MKILKTSMPKTIEHALINSLESCVGLDNFEISEILEINTISSNIKNKFFDILLFYENDSTIIPKKIFSIIKKDYPNVITVTISNSNKPSEFLDMCNLGYRLPRGDGQYDDFFKLVVKTLMYVHEIQQKLISLTITPTAVIDFANCSYDPTRRVLYRESEEIKKLSQKEGGLLEVLVSNFRNPVKKELILEKVWGKNNYYMGRSMDVYITHLRNLFKKYNLPFTIRNLTGIGLILE